VIAQELGAWLRREREARNWTRSEMARRLIRAACASGDRTMPGAGNISHNIYRWERGTVTPSERYKFYYCHAFGISSSDFGTLRGESREHELSPSGGDAAALFNLLAEGCVLLRELLVALSARVTPEAQAIAQVGNAISAANVPEIRADLDSPLSLESLV
jgi:transcriptional regulator with XRE-family HTH domain